MARVVSAVRRGLILLLVTAGIGLVAFHGWLLVSTLADGRILDPAVAGRWIAAAALAVGLCALRRAGIPMIRSRQGAVVWVLVLLLHASAADGVGPLPGAPDGADGVALLFVLPTTTAGVVATVVLLTGRLGATRRTDAFRSGLLRLWLLGEHLLLASASGFAPALGPRAPPRSATLFAYSI